MPVSLQPPAIRHDVVVNGARCPIGHADAGHVDGWRKHGGSLPVVTQGLQQLRNRTIARGSDPGQVHLAKVQPDVETPAVL